MVIPSPAVSMATARIMPSMAAFAAPYAAEPGLLTSGPVTDVTFTIRPYFCCVIPGNTARVMRKAVCKLVLPLRERSLHQRLAARWPPGLRHARVVFQDVDPARAREYGIDKSLHVGFDGEISNEG